MPSRRFCKSHVSPSPLSSPCVSCLVFMDDKIVKFTIASSNTNYEAAKSKSTFSRCVTGLHMANWKFLLEHSCGALYAMVHGHCCQDFLDNARHLPPSIVPNCVHCRQTGS